MSRSQRWKYALLVVPLAAAGLVWFVGGSIGQNAQPAKQGKAEEPLPIRQVVLFNSGVGYFQREGVVKGDARLELSFPVSEVNDLLKSLVLQDLGGGHISTVNYDSHDPIDKILRSFMVDLNNNPTFGQILNQTRGEKVEVTYRPAEAKQPLKTIGAIVGLEVKKRPVAKDTPPVDQDYLNLSTPGGVSSIAMDDVLAVQFLNPTLQKEFQRALEVLAGSHDVQKKKVSLGFTGNGERAVRVGYVVDRPIWKTSYRLRLDPNGKVYLQGWAIVENVSDDDWNDVRIVLVSGRPISFRMNLYEPLYIPRPLVEPELFASLRPPVYEGGLVPGEPAAKTAPGMAGPPGAPPMPGAAGGFGGRGLNAYQQQILERNQEQFRRLDQNLNKLTFDELQRRRQQQGQVAKDAREKGALIAGLNFKEGIQSVASASAIGDYYRYLLDEKISLPRQKSAMLPILQQDIEGRKISIFNETTHAKYPMLGLRLKNTSGQPLTQGPITVYDEGSYAGDTRILDVQPGEERLLSYAMDLSTEVKKEVKVKPSPDMNLRIDQSQLAARYTSRQTTSYIIRNRAEADRIVLLEHPIRTDWNLVEPKKPLEKTRSHYRFHVKVPAGKTVTQDIIEEQARLDQFALTHRGGQPLYALGMGIEVKPVLHRSEDKLIGLKIKKGQVTAKHRQKESKTYFVQNLSDQDCTFTVDHIVRPDWVRLVDKGQEQKGPAVFRFELKVAQGKTGTQDIEEERTFEQKPVYLKEVTPQQIKLWLNTAVPSDAVKAGFTKYLTLSDQVKETREKLDQTNSELTRLEKDQSRLRENLKIIPQSQDAYKKFLDKFVAQETRIEELQQRIRDTQATLEAQTRTLDLFVATLNAE